MRISRINKGSWGKVRAFFDVETDEGFTMKGFKLIEGINGLFVSMPSEKNKDGDYQDTVFASKQLRQEVNKIAMEDAHLQAMAQGELGEEDASQD